MTCGSGLTGLCRLAPTTQLRTIVGAQEEAKSFESEKSCVQRYSGKICGPLNSVLNKRTIQEPMIQPERRVMPISYENSVDILKHPFRDWRTCQNMDKTPKGSAGVPEFAVSSSNQRSSSLATRSSSAFIRSSRCKRPSEKEKSLGPRSYS
uniref:Uncharacterized protein n=1 Tax=Populus alba TaxID=43335 RepID=A0A4U5PYJ7_POPAL|nr:hypothetical protein D5086_0000160950 [Populus alba]